jgi:signal transduction histidine kinase
VTALLVLGVATAAAVLPTATLISYLVLRRTIRRLEELTATAGALRSGDLAARVPIGGEDEVAQLQGSFNAMAGDLERTLRDLEAERDRVAGLLEARRQLVAGVSHELRTPVTTVRGYLESALRRVDDVPPDLRADLETMESEIARLQRLIEDLFTLSRAAVGRLELRREPIDTGAVVRRLVETTAPLAWRQWRVEVLADIAPDLPPARADAQRLAQIVSNLLGNAVRHTPPGGLVAAAVAAEPDAVRVEVRDTGEGIAPEDLPRVFERFYRGRNGDGQGGAGLGLALTRELAEAMGGTVEATSAPGEGSRFTVRPPRA